MLHKLKVSISSSAEEKCILKADQRLANIDTQLSVLLCTIPVVQKRIEENERAWSVLSYSIRTVGNAFRHTATLDNASPASQELYNCSDALVVTGEKLPNPRVSRAHRELRSFCETIRALRLQQTKAVEALRRRCYYAKKIKTIQQAASNQSAASAARDALALRLKRNEAKFEQADEEVASLTALLEKDVGRIVERKDVVLATAMRAFVELQLKCFHNESLESLVDKVPAVEGYSDTDGLNSVGTSMDATTGSNYRSGSQTDSAFSDDNLEALVSNTVETEVDTFLPRPSMIDGCDDDGFDTADDEEGSRSKR